MIKKSKLKKQIFSLGFLFFIFLLFVSPVSAETALQQAQGGLDLTAKCGYGNCDAQSVGATGVMTSIPTAIGRIIGVVLSFVGALFLLLMIYGGVIWMTARGNEAEVTKAKDLITAAVIGLVIVLAAYAITAFVGEQLT